MFWTIKSTNCTRHIDNYSKLRWSPLAEYWRVQEHTQKNTDFPIRKKKLHAAHSENIRRSTCAARTPTHRRLGAQRALSADNGHALCGAWLRSSTFYCQFAIDMDVRNVPQVKYSNVCMCVCVFARQQGIFCISLFLSVYRLQSHQLTRSMQIIDEAVSKRIKNTLMYLIPYRLVPLHKMLLTFESHSNGKLLLNNPCVLPVCGTWPEPFAKTQ